MATAGGPEIVIVAALAERDRLIGDGLDLPWRIPKDLRRFKQLTLGHPLVMGRRTFESLVHQFGGPLAGRTHAVLTRRGLPPNLRAAAEGGDVRVFASLEEALAAFRGHEQVSIGGGASVYAAALPIAHRLELTLVEGDFTGDTYFPPYEHLTEGASAVFRLAASEAHPAEGTTPAFRFETWVRTRPGGRGNAD